MKLKKTFCVRKHFVSEHILLKKTFDKRNILLKVTSSCKAGNVL